MKGFPQGIKKIDKLKPENPTTTKTKTKTKPAAPKDHQPRPGHQHYDLRYTFDSS
jgi:hypothetical protein